MLHALYALGETPQYTYERDDQSEREYVCVHAKNPRRGLPPVQWCDVVGYARPRLMVCVSGGCGMVAIGGVPVFVADRLPGNRQ